jgi:hypothetical protein
VPNPAGEPGTAPDTHSDRCRLLAGAGCGPRTILPRSVGDVTGAGKPDVVLAEYIEGLVVVQQA